MRLLIPLLSLALFACGPAGDSGTDAEPAAPALPDGEVVMDSVESEEATFRVVQVVDSLEHPWAVDWLPDGRTLITERPGRLLLVDGDSTTVLSGVPEVLAQGQGGLLDVRVAPDYGETGWVYLAYSMQEDSLSGTVLSRARLQGTGLTEVQEVYRQTPFLGTDYHFGSRIVFPDDSTLLVALGERGQRLLPRGLVLDLVDEVLAHARGLHDVGLLAQVLRDELPGVVERRLLVKKLNPKLTHRLPVFLSGAAHIGVFHRPWTVRDHLSSRRN